MAVARVVSIGLSVWGVLTVLGCPEIGVAGEQKESGTFDVRAYGAVGDGVTIDTGAIQAAVDACGRAGGGIVRIRRGTFLSGTVDLRDHVTIEVESGAVLLASTRQEDFSSRSLLHAEGVEHITVTGGGVIDGNGAVSTEFPKVRSHLIHFIECTNVKVKDVTFRNSTTWIQHYFKCDNLTVDGVTVRSRINPDIEKPRHLPGAPGRNEDGLNLNSCRNVRVSNCDIFSDDDALVLKSTSERPCENVVITNCLISANASGIKFGTESGGGFLNVTISNCAIYDTRNAGIALEVVDGGTMDRVNISNIVMDNVKGSAIFLRLGNRGRPYKGENPGVGSMRNIIISNVQATRVGDWIEPAGKRVVGCPISGLPDAAIENVTLRDIRIEFKGGGTTEDAARDIRERPDAYPSCRMFGTLPAYGFFVRHVKNITFDNVDLSFLHDDPRPAMIFDDVSDLRISGFDAQSLPTTAGGLICLKQTTGAWIHGCRLTRPTRTFLRVEGDKSGRITLMNNDFGNVEQLVDKAGDVAAEAVYTANNRTP